MISRSDKVTSIDHLVPENSLKAQLITEKIIDAGTAREARRLGFLKRASDDLYENTETKDIWKINTANGTIERVG